jgi:hypothetical protein
MLTTRSATVVSFAWGDDYYHQAAQRLRDDCSRLGIEHHVVAADLPEGTTWIDACRYKVRFMAECRARFDGPLWWVDVDCRLLRALPELGGAVDLAFFLRGFRDLRAFDPVALPRVLQPSILYFGTGTSARRFVALMSELESAHPGQATDDWFLHEAWVRSETQPCAVVMPPEWVQLEDSHAPQAVFDFGRSGHAGEFKGQAQQHEIDLFSPARRKALFLREVSQALREGNATEVQFFLRKAWKIDPADAGLAQRVARGWEREGRKDEADRVLRQVPPSESACDHVRRFRLDAALGGGQVDVAARLAQDLIAGAHQADRDWALGRQLRIGLEQRARSARLRPEDRPMLWWMEGPFPGNFGDILNPYLVEKLTGKPPRFGPKGEGVLAIGSTIRFARDGAAVWGAGAPRLTDRLNPRARYLAVRGPITARLVESCGAALPGVLGDPAAILPRVYTPRSTPGPRHALGVVLHHAHEGRLRFGPEVKVISVLRAGYAGIEAFIDELHQCERILSSSLHGLIVSHAYGIPAQWFTVVDDPSHAVPGDGTKFHDYHLSIGLEESSPLLLEAGSLVDGGARTSEYLPARPIDVDRLLEAAPWPLRHIASR